MLPLGNEPKPYYTDAMWSLIDHWLINKHTSEPLTVTAVEIGSFRGEWAHGLLNRFPCVERLFCVDPWSKDEKHEEHLRDWFTLLDPWIWKKVFPLRGTSEAWSKVFPIKKIDLLYVDAMHNYPNVIRDLKLWAPLVRKGGLVIGHDWNMSGVQKAAKEYFGKVDVADTGPRKPNRESGGRSVMNQSFWKIV